MFVFMGGRKFSARVRFFAKPDVADVKQTLNFIFFLHFANLRNGVNVPY